MAFFTPYPLFVTQVLVFFLKVYLVPLIVLGSFSLLFFLIIAGGIGFIVLNDLYLYQRVRKLSTHSKVVLATTGVLIGFSWMVLFIFEFSNPETLGKLPFISKVMNALFLSVTPRTAGFTTIPISMLTNVSLFLLVLLMFVGASPGGTGGGIKTTSFCVVIATLWATLRGRKNVNLFKRRMSQETIQKAFTIAAMVFVFVCVVTLVLLVTEKKDFIRTFFEATSAFGTVGLSTGMTSDLSSWGKTIIMITMFVGRLGPLTLGLAAFQEGRLPFRYAEEKIMIG